jgi:hypothetical protein
MAREFPGFIAWDGEETRDAGYCLFGASKFGVAPDASTTLQRPHLQPADMLNLLLEVASDNPGAAHVAYSFDYDVNWLIQELSWPELITLRLRGEVNWRGYKLGHIPHKIFTVESEGSRIRIDDVFSYFRTRYDKALYKYEIGTRVQREKISNGKDSRAEFLYRDIDQIREYWGLELETMCLLMNRVRSMAVRAGFGGIKQWHGPGALAAYSLRKNKTAQHMKMSPPKVLHAALSAYAGGWFERFRFGVHDGYVATADINSAYVYAMSLLPDLHKGHWEYRRTDLERLARECSFGLFRTQWRISGDAYMRACDGVPFPLFHRDNDGSVRRPCATDVWLWNPEACNVTATPFARLTEAWIYVPDNDDDYPFSWVAAMYDNRLALQADNDPAEKILKWALASYYGRLAQRTGWNEKAKSPPEFHQIEWAGWITSKCRAMIYRAALDVAMRGGLVSIDTDGIISTVPFGPLENGTGNQLGRWKVEEYDGLVYIQNGIYWLRREAEWEDPKLRGIPRTKLDVSVAIKALSEAGSIDLVRHSFRGYGAAIRGKRDEWRQWVDDEISISPFNAGNRSHSDQFCGTCRSGNRDFTAGLHQLMLVPNRQLKSRPHILPWMEEGNTADRKLAAMLAREDPTDFRWSERIADGLSGVR